MSNSTTPAPTTPAPMDRFLRISEVGGGRDGERPGLLLALNTKAIVAIQPIRNFDENTVKIAITTVDGQKFIVGNLVAHRAETVLEELNRQITEPIDLLVPPATTVTSE